MVHARVNKLQRTTYLQYTILSHYYEYIDKVQVHLRSQTQVFFLNLEREQFCYFGERKNMHLTEI